MVSAAQRASLSLAALCLVRCRIDAFSPDSRRISTGRQVVSNQQVGGSPSPAVRHAFGTRTDSADDVQQNEESQRATTSESSDQEAKAPLVRRTYETFLWRRTRTKEAADGSGDDDATTPYCINYRAEGPIDGPPVLLVHGFGANVNHFRFQFPVLAQQEGHRVYAVDLLGFGASDKPGDAPYSIELFTELLVDFLESMHTREGHADRGRRWVVAGNSIGGLCSLNVARTVPHLVRGIVLFNCAGGMTGFRYDDVSWYFRPVLWFVQNVLLGQHFGPGFFADFKTRRNVESILREQGVYRDPRNVDEELLELLLVPGDDDGAGDVFLSTFAGPPGPTPESILPLLTCPILAIWGGADPWTPVDAGSHPGTRFGDCVRDGVDFQLEVLPGVGHCPHDEAPDAVHAKLVPWLRQLPN